MPEFKNRDEYEKWKNEKLMSNLEARHRVNKENKIEDGQHTEPNINGESLKEKELRSIEELFKDSWELFKYRFITLLSLYLLSILLPCLCLGIFILVAYSLSVFFPVNKNIMIAGGALVGMIPGFLVMFWGLAAFTCAVVDKPLGIRDALRKGWQRMGSFMWLYSLMSFIITGGFLLLIIPGVIFTVWFIFAQFIIVSESDKGMNAILKSKEYVSEKWFDIFLRLLVIWLVAGGIGVIPIIGPIISIVFFPFTMIFLYLTYEDLKALKGDGMVYPHSSGEKFKWVGIGTLGYVVLPFLIFAFLGAAITIPLLMFRCLL
jgi:hypothetical protein